MDTERDAIQTQCLTNKGFFQLYARGEWRNPHLRVNTSVLPYKKTALLMMLGAIINIILSHKGIAYDEAGALSVDSILAHEGYVFLKIYAEFTLEKLNVTENLFT